MESTKDNKADTNTLTNTATNASTEESQLKNSSETNYKENILVHREKLLSTRAFDGYYKKYIISKN